MNDVLYLSVKVMLPYITPAIFILLAVAVAESFTGLLNFAVQGNKRRSSY